MRILHVIPSLSPIHGGPSRALPLMEQTLSAAGLLVETVTTDDDGPRRHNGKILGVPLSENGVIRHYFRKQTDFYKISLSLVHWLKRSIKNYDLLHIHGLFSYTSVAAAQISRKAEVPYVIHPLGVLNIYGMTQRHVHLKRFSFRWIEGPLLKNAATVHFTSSKECKEAEELGFPFQPVVIPLGIDFQPEKENDFVKRKPWLLFLSRLDPKKNLEGLLRAWKKLAFEFTDWQLIIAGSGERTYVQKLYKLSHSLKLELRVNWLGQLEEGRKKESLFREAGLFILPSFSESFGIAAVEAMGAGVPCILGEGVAVAQEGGKVGACAVTAPQEEAIYECLKELLQNSLQRQNLSVCGRQFARREYGLSTMGQRLHQLYKTILKNNTHATRSDYPLNYNL